MRIKVGDRWFEIGEHHPLMVELSPDEKRQLQNMAPHTTRFAQFLPGDPLHTNEETRKAWMDEGARITTEHPLQTLKIEPYANVVDHAKGMFGWHGGVGDPPDDETVVAIVMGVLDFISAPQTEDDNT